MIWVDYKPVNVEIDDDNTGIVRVFEIRIGMNEFDHRMMIFFFLVLFNQQRQRPENSGLKGIRTLKNSMIKSIRTLALLQTTGNDDDCSLGGAFDRQFRR